MDQKLTDRHHTLNNCQIINFVAEPDLNWFAVTGIAQEDGRIAGHIQLYSKSRNVSQAIEGHVCKFASISLSGGVQPTKVSVLVIRMPKVKATCILLRLIMLMAIPISKESG